MFNDLILMVLMEESVRRSVVSNSLRFCSLQQARLSVLHYLPANRSLLKFMSIELVMLSNYLVLCHALLLPPSIFPSVRVFSRKLALRIMWPKYWSFSFSISPSSEYSALISLRVKVPATFFSLDFTC